MAIALVAHVSAHSAAGGDITTTSIDTTGATLLVAAVSATTPSVSDSKGNTWATAIAGTGVPTTTMFYVKNPTVGTGHTFTGSGTVPAICVFAYSGTDTTADVDQSSAGANTSQATAQPGSVTPTVNNEVIVTAFGDFSNIPNYSVDSGFTIQEHQNYTAGAAFGIAMADLIQTTATAENPTWTPGSTGTCTAIIATFKASGGPSIPQEMPGVESWPIAWGPRYV